MVFPESYGQESASTQSVDWAVDFENGCMALKNGKPYLVYELDALRVFVQKALRTDRGVFVAYEEDFGCDKLAQIGDGAIKQRITQALKHPDILGVHSFEFKREEAMLSISFVVDTIYGEMDMTREVAI